MITHYQNSIRFFLIYSFTVCTLLEKQTMLFSISTQLKKKKIETWIDEYFHGRKSYGHIQTELFWIQFLITSA